MKTARLVLLGAAPLLVLACGSVAPVKVNAGDQCFRCRRTIVDTRMAAETIDKFVSRYRAPGCLAKAIVTHNDEGRTVYVTDYTTGTMFSPTKAFFVPVLLDRDTGERDYRAYRNKADADAAALEARTVPVDWNTVLDKAR